MNGPLLLHATAAAVRTGGDWVAALIRGPSGSGKSDLALRLMERGWRLVADDYVQVWADQGRLWCAAPQTLPEAIEARGVGLISQPLLRQARVGAWVELEAEPERLPEASLHQLCGVPLPRLTLTGVEASAPYKLMRVITAGGRA